MSARALNWTKSLECVSWTPVTKWHKINPCFIFSTPVLSTSAEKMLIPTRFSIDTMTTLKQGVLRSNVQDQITTSLSTLIMVHTIRPTTDDYTTVCR